MKRPAAFCACEGAWLNGAISVNEEAFRTPRHFAKKDPSVIATYRRVLDVARAHVSTPPWPHSAANCT